MRQRDPNWLEDILQDAERRVAGKPNWLRSPELQAEFRRIEERKQAREMRSEAGTRDEPLPR